MSCWRSRGGRSGEKGEEGSYSPRSGRLRSPQRQGSPPGATNKKGAKPSRSSTAVNASLRGGGHTSKPELMRLAVGREVHSGCPKKKGV